MNMKVILEHLMVVLAALCLTLAVGLPFGILSYFNKTFKNVIFRITDILQTIPSLALLGIIMIFLGGNKLTVIVGLFLYSLLPVVRNTYTGLSGIDPAVKEAAKGMGMGKLYQLIHVELPIAFPVIFTGIRIAVINQISAAVFGTFVGGGGLGTVIYRGMATMNMKMILFGTGSLMVMAVLFDTVMGMVEKRLYARTR